MTVLPGGDYIAKITDLRRNASTLLKRIRKAKREQDSRVILTARGEPVAVLQDYESYKKMLVEVEKARLSARADRVLEQVALGASTHKLEDAAKRFNITPPSRPNDVRS